jgi:hypothetical protein
MLLHANYDTVSGQSLLLIYNPRYLVLGVVDRVGESSLNCFWDSLEISLAMNMVDSELRGVYLLCGLWDNRVLTTSGGVCLPNTVFRCLSA